MTELQEAVVDFAAIYLVGLVIMTFLAALAFALGWILDRPWCRVFVALFLAFMIWCLASCTLPREPCMTGFEVGANGGTSSGQQFGDRYEGENVGGHVTVYFDTTGACRAE